MATGYSDYRRSQKDASDTIHDHPCTPCSDEGKNTEAVFQCVDCQIFFCQICVSGHKKFTKNHHVIDNNSKLFGQGIKQARGFSTELPSDVCEEHHGEVIKMFCGTHDEVCCSVCIAVKHRSCDGVEYIPNIAKGILQRPDKEKMKRSLEQVNNDLRNVKTDVQDELNTLNKQRDGVIDEIETFERRIIARVEELKKKSLEELKKAHKKIADDILANRSDIDDIIKGVEIQLNKLKVSKNVKEAQTFVDIKFCEKQLSQGKECVKRSTTCTRNVKTVSFAVANDIEKQLQDTLSFGTLTVADPNQTTDQTCFGVKIISPSSFPGNQQWPLPSHDVLIPHQMQISQGPNDKTKGASFPQEYGYRGGFGSQSGPKGNTTGASYPQQYGYRGGFGSKGGPKGNTTGASYPQKYGYRGGFGSKGGPKGNTTDAGYPQECGYRGGFGSKDGWSIQSKERYSQGFEFWVEYDSNGELKGAGRRRASTKTRDDNSSGVDFCLY